MLKAHTKERAPFIDKRPFEAAPGRTTPGPYVEIFVTSMTDTKKRSESFIAKVDTGADISCIPKKVVKVLMPLLSGKLLTTMGYDGKLQRIRSYHVLVAILGDSREGGSGKKRLRWLHPPRGVLLTDSDVGFLGLDVIGEDCIFTYNSDARTFSIEWTTRNWPDDGAA